MTTNRNMLIPGKLYHLKTREPKTVCTGDPDQQKTYYYEYGEVLIYIGEESWSRRPYVVQIFWRVKTGDRTLWDTDQAKDHIGPLA